MYWIDILSRLQLVSFFFCLAGLVSVIPIVVMFLDEGTEWKPPTRMMIITFILFLISALVAFFAPSAEYIEFLKGGICE